MPVAPGSEPQWSQFARRFGVEVFDIYSSAEEMVADICATTNAKERSELFRLVDQWAANMTDAELVGIWRRGGAEFRVNSKSARYLIEQCRKALQSQ